MQRWPRTPVSWIWFTSGENGVKLSVSTHIGLNQPTSWLFMEWICLFVPLVHWKWHDFVFPLPPPGHLTIVQTLLIVVSVGDTSLSPSTQDFNFIHWAAGRWPVPTAKVNTSGLLCLGRVGKRESGSLDHGVSFPGTCSGDGIFMAQWGACSLGLLV